MPAWALAASGGGTPPTPPPTAPTTGMMFWAHGYNNGITSAFEPDSGLWLVSNIKDWAGQNQDLNEVEAGKEPIAKVYTVDGNPLWSYGDEATARYIRRNATMKKSNGVAITPAEVRTFWSVILPQTFTDPEVGFPITGGPLFCFDEGPYFEPLFDLESFFHVDGFYLFDTAWRFDGAQISGPDTPAATYANVPTIVCCIGAATTGSPVKVYVNGSLVATLPATSGGVEGPSQAGFISGNCRKDDGAINAVPFMGGIAEQIAYDYDQSTNPTDFAATLAYLRSVYPSVP